MAGVDESRWSKRKQTLNYMHSDANLLGSLMFYRISSRRKRKQRKKNQRTMWSKTHQILNRLMFACFLSSRYFWIQFRVFSRFFLVSDHFVQFNALVSMVFFHTAFVSSDFDVSLNEIVCYFSNCLAHHTMINHNVVVQCSQLRQLTYVTSPWIIPPKWLNKEIRCWIIHSFSLSMKRE